jgi:polyhydroxyalkanoate synthesis regulator phasin
LPEWPGFFHQFELVSLESKIDELTERVRELEEELKLGEETESEQGD